MDGDWGEVGITIGGRRGVISYGLCYTGDFEAKANCIDRMTHFLSRVGRIEGTLDRIHDPQYYFLLYCY